MSRYQHGYIYEASNAFHVRYYVTVDGVRKQKSHRLCTKDRNTGCGSRSAKAVQQLAEAHMRTINTDQPANETDMPVVVYWETRFLPYCEEVMQTGPRKGKTRRKASTLKGYKQIWKQFLRPHFDTITLQQYQPRLGRRFLDSLTAKKSYYQLKHIKSLATKIFERAVTEEIIPLNPWSAIKLPEDVIEPANTPHYTREESEDLVSALVDHLDAQLVLSLACFLALGNAEIQGLRWEDVDANWIHIRRNIVEGEEDTLKTTDREDSLPILDEVRVPLELWRAKCGNPSEGWLFGDRPIDLHNLIARVIRPHVEGKKECERCRLIPKASRVRWKRFYAARRGAITHAINVSGNIALGQRLARHASPATTAQFYHKVMPDSMFVAGMKMLKK
jgi:integrase